MATDIPASAIWWGLGILGLGAVALMTYSAHAATPTIPPAQPLDGPGSASLPGVNGQPPTQILDYGATGLLTGSSFAAQIAGRDDNTREQLIAKAITDGQYPAFLHQLVPVPVSAPGGVTGTVYVTPDFLGVGVGDDWLRTPMRPGTAQRVANALGMVLPTKAIADAVHAAAPVQMRMAYVANDKSSTAAYVTAQNDIERRVPAGSQGTLTDGQKKNILAADSRHPGNVVIYGANSPDTGAWPIQGYQAVQHNAGYVDYSHGVRLVSRIVDVDGRGRMDIGAVMADPTLAPLVSSGSFDRGTSYA